MAAKKQRSEESAPAAEDARVTRLLEAMEADRALAPAARAYREQAHAAGPRRFGANGLKAGGKLFALFTQETLVVKLPKERVEALVAARVGVPFDPGHGRLMKGWLTVTGAKAGWLDLVREAHAFVAASGGGAD